MSALDKTQVWVGRIIARRYRIGRTLGQGGMGIVFEADDLETQGTVAIKVLIEREYLDPSSVLRFFNEARTAAKIKSEHVATVLAVGMTDEGLPYIAMERLDGMDLGALLSARGSLPTAEAVGYILDALDAIACAHGEGVVHRDLKPSNLFLAKTAAGPIVKVLDFGISKVIRDEANIDALSLTSTKQLLGSPHYMSPEQVRSAKRVDARSDIWSLGAVMFELLSGQKPFQGESVGEVLAAVLELEPPRLEDVVAGAPPALCAAIRQCLARRPDARFGHVGELAAAIAPFAPARAAIVLPRIRGLEGILRQRARASLPSNFDLLPGVTPRGGTAVPHQAAMEEARTITWNDVPKQALEPHAVEAASPPPHTRGRGRGWVAAAAVLVGIFGGAAGLAGLKHERARTQAPPLAVSAAAAPSLSSFASPSAGAGASASETARTAPPPSTAGASTSETAAKPVASAAGAAAAAGAVGSAGAPHPRAKAVPPRLVKAPASSPSNDMSLDRN